MWIQFDAQNPRVQITGKESSENLYKLSTNKLARLMESMQKSQSKKLADKGSFLLDDLDNKKLVLELLLDKKTNKVAGFITRMGQKGKIERSIMMEMSTLLESTTATRLALVLAHEGRHLENFDKRRKDMEEKATKEGRVLTDIDVLDAEDSFFADPANKLSDEADAYAFEMEAYLELFSLGYRGNTELLDMARKYVEYGRNAKDSRWINYIDRFQKEDPLKSR